MPWKTLDDLDLDGKRALVRVDVNVPVEDGRVTDDTRIRRILPTLRDILARGGLPVLLAHFGRPKGKPDPAMSLRVVVDALSDITGAPVVFGEDCIGEKAAQAVADAGPGAVVLLENTRFHPGEERNDPDFAAALAENGDVYVNDAFSAAHRAHASTEALARLLPACAGRNMQAELEALERALATPERPVVAVIGGAKVSSKLDLIGNLLGKVDQIVIGGGMANTFLAAEGKPVGTSLCEHDMLDTARQIMKDAEGRCEIVLPVDIVCASEFKAGADHITVAADRCPEDRMILDAGPESIAAVSRRFEAAKTIVWNGPLGAFELPPFNAATDAAALKAAALTRSGAVLSVAGGGDTVSALNGSGAAADFSYISTAGGAFLEWLEGRTLPGIAALEG